jgi:hypothetical protein
MTAAAVLRQVAIIERALNALDYPGGIACDRTAEGFNDDAELHLAEARFAMENFRKAWKAPRRRRIRQRKLHHGNTDESRKGTRAGEAGHG